MFPHEKRWLLRILEAFAPHRDGLWSAAGSRTAYLSAFELIHSCASPKARLGLRFALWLVALSPIWLTATIRTMAGLSLDERAGMLHRLCTHRIYAVRELSTLLKLTCTMAMFSVADLRVASGYERDASAMYDAEEISGTRPSRRSLPLAKPGPPATVQHNTAHPAPSSSTASVAPCPSDGREVA